VSHRPPNSGSGRLNWRDVGVLFAREMRSALREKSIVLNSILIPVCLFPFLLWAIFSGIMYMEGRTQGFVSRVVVGQWPEGHPGLKSRFKLQDDFLLISPGGGDPKELLRRESADAILEFLPGTNSAGLAADFQARVTYDESKERSDTAMNRIEAEIRDYTAGWFRREALNRGVAPDEWRGSAVVSENVASKKQMGSFIMGLILPVIFVIMVSMGCLYPAVDTMAGERERNTWETLMSAGVSRESVLAAKFLHITAMGTMAGGLNVLSIALTTRPIFDSLGNAGKGLDMSAPLSALPALALAAVLLAGLIGAVMMILASFARTFAEGQSMVIPFYSVLPLTLLFLQMPGLKFSAGLALIPVINLTMMTRAALAGEFPALPIALALGETLCLIYLCLRLSAFILKFEDFIAGTYSGGVWKFLRSRLAARRKKPI